ncbi:MAG: hypothetical protein ACYDG6_02425 [Thermincolia bacterium]
MVIKCKCGFEHNDQNNIVRKRNPIFNQVRPICGRCGRRIYVRSVGPGEYKRLLKAIEG